jgi:hypothetical protein
VKPGWICLLVTVALPIPVAARQQERLAISVEPHVLDARGTDVGKLVGTNELFMAKVAFEVGGNVFVLEVFRDWFQGNAGDIFFESSDCTGQPFLGGSGPSVSPLPLVTVREPGSTVYIPMSGAATESITVGSRLQSPDFTPGCHEEPASFTFSVVPAIPLIDLSQSFTPPFHVGLPKRGK